MLSKMAIAILRRLSREFLETRLLCSNISDLPLLVPWKRYIRHVKECRVRIMIRIYDGRYHCLRTTATPQSHHSIDKHRVPSGIVQPNQMSSSFDKQNERLVTGSKAPNGHPRKEEHAVSHCKQTGCCLSQCTHDLLSR